MNRTTVYKTYKEIDNKKLLKQQIFLSSYITSNFNSIDKLLLFHGIGSGKTCTSITIAESIMKTNKNYKVLVLLPARLKTNFIDELISETCGNLYISTEDYNKYINPNTSDNDKKTIRQRFMKKINKNYDINSYEKIRNIFLKSTNLKNTIIELTRNKIIIIDEVHNLIASKLDPLVINTIIKNNKIPKKPSIRSINAVILRLLTLLNDPSCKMFFLTATPIFDNFGQFNELILTLRPDLHSSKISKNPEDLKTLINLLKNKVSFYKLKDRSSYPSTQEDNIRIKISETQQELINEIKKEDENENENEEIEGDNFCMKERQLSISAYDYKKKDLIFSNLREYAPKIKKLIELLKLPGKHVIYSNFIKYCLELIAAYLEEKGWTNYTKETTHNNNYKTFVLWDASLNDKQKQDVKMVLNSTANMDGKIIRIVLGSPSIKEGISFKHIQHLHQIDPVWNSSAKEQIEGRCIRHKSHDDIPINHKTLKRKVIIHNYIAVYPTSANITCDDNIYTNIIPTKRKIINILEKYLHKISFDYYLWNDNSKSPLSKSKSSLISVSSTDIEPLKNIKKIGVKKDDKNKYKGCPKIRRPVNNKCLNPDYFIKKNKHDVNCCYKSRIEKPLNKEKEKEKDNKPPININNTCPKSRRPVNNECPNPTDIIKKNKHGIDCCYKK